jgi:hypothetical protein
MVELRDLGPMLGRGSPTEVGSASLNDLIKILNKYEDAMREFPG